MRDGLINISHFLVVRVKIYTIEQTIEQNGYTVGQNGYTVGQTDHAISAATFVVYQGVSRECVAVGTFMLARPCIESIASAVVRQSLHLKR